MNFKFIYRAPCMFYDNTEL